MMANIWWSLPLTLIVFFAARKLAARYKFPLLNPLLVAMVVIIPFLMLDFIALHIRCHRPFKSSHRE